MIRENIVFDVPETHIGKGDAAVRNLRNELFNKEESQEEVMDKYDEQNGNAPRRRASVKKTVKKNILLEPKDGNNDQIFFNELLNEEKYTIVYTKDSFNQFGSYTLFLIYTEELDEEAKDKAVTTTK